jgi:CelD/BcsL family acetyltransferase involved in cellulose biosynthesis
MPESKAEEIVLCLHADLNEIEPEWKAFERHCVCTALQTFEWLTNCHRHLGKPNGAKAAIVFGRDSYGQLLFILPLAVVPRGPLRCLTWLGSNLFPHNAPLLAENFLDRVSERRFARLWREIVSRLRADRRFRFDWIDLQKAPEKIGMHRNPFVGLQGAAERADGDVDELPVADCKMFDYLAPATIGGRIVVALVAPLRQARQFMRQTAFWNAFRQAGVLAISIDWR